MPPPLLATSFQSIYQFFVQGGSFMVLLLICSVVSVAVIVVRGLALRRDIVMPPEIEDAIEVIQPGDQSTTLTHLTNVVNGDRSALGRIIQIGIRHLNWPKSENVEAVQTRARHEVVRLESGLFVLEVIVGIAPLLGLLGAVSGLVTVFANLGSSDTVSDPRGIARGVSEALSTTIVGLAIAIPSLIAHSYFSKKIETMSAEMESLIADLLAKCYSQQTRWQSARVTPPPAPAKSFAGQSATAPKPDATVEEEVL